MEKISSPQNGRIKKFIQLHRSRGRLKQGRIAIFGVREIRRAILCGLQPDELFVCMDLVSESVIAWLRQEVANFEAVSFSLDAQLFAKVCFGDRSDGVVMSAKRPDPSKRGFFQQLSHDRPVVAIAESIEKPGNLGAIMRSVDGAGIDGLIIADPVTDWFHPNTIRASLGTCFSLPGWIEAKETICERLIQQGFQIVVAALQTTRNFYEIDLRKKTAIVLGNEATGVSEFWRDGRCIEAALPMRGISDSLNVSVAAAVMFYETQRQRSESA